MGFISIRVAIFYTGSPNLPQPSSFIRAWDRLAYPQGFKIPEFVKFTGDDSRTILEHIGQFIIQCGKASTSDIYKLRLFPLFLSSAAFT